MSMSKDDAIRLLQKLFDWKYNSLSAYIVEAEPYVSEGKEGLVEIMRDFAQDDQTLSDAASAAIRELGAIPHVNPHEQSIAELNYLSIEFLCSMLAKKLAEQEQELARHHDALLAIPEAHEVVSMALDTIRAQRLRLSA